MSTLFADAKRVDIQNMRESLALPTWAQTKRVNNDLVVELEVVVGDPG